MHPNTLTTPEEASRVYEVLLSQFIRMEELRDQRKLLALDQADLYLRDSLQHQQSHGLQAASQRAAEFERGGVCPVCVLPV